MTKARKDIVDVNVTRYYHCISECVRQAALCGNGFEHRKEWIESRLEELSHAFAIGICGYAVMDNHLHTLVKLEPERAEEWSDEEVVRRWMIVYPPSGVDLEDEKAVSDHVRKQLEDPDQVALWRERLADLSWFMKRLKEPIARRANQEDDCRGSFWASRFKSIALLDEEAILACCAYIDLNPVAAGIAPLPESSPYTSIRQRVEHIRRQKGGFEKLKAAKEQPTVANREALGKLERDHWLCPIQDQRSSGATRGGVLKGMSLAGYLLLVDYTSRLPRKGKAHVSHEVAGIFERLETTAENWTTRLRQLFGSSRLKGIYFATDRQRLREVAEQKGCNRLINLAGCPT
ncbi:MAG TPA: transposase [Planctomycetaceae bacterium]|nr:transposase [Planctomycetaceae bacterium]